MKVRRLLGYGLLGGGVAGLAGMGLALAVMRPAELRLVLWTLPRTVPGGGAQRLAPDGLIQSQESNDAD